MGHTQLITTGYILKILSDKERFGDFLGKKNITQRRLLLPGIKLLFRFIFDEHIRQIEAGNGFTLERDRMTTRALFVGIDLREISSNSHLAKVLRRLRQAESIVLQSTTVSDFIDAIHREFNLWLRAIDKLWSNATGVFRAKLQSIKRSDVRTLQVFSSLLMVLNIKSRLSGYIRYSQSWQKTSKSRKEKFWGVEFQRCFIGYKVGSAYLWDFFRNRYTPKSPVDEILATKDWNDLDNMFRGVADGVVARADKILGSSFEAAFYKTKEYNPAELRLVKKDAELKRGRKLNDRLDESFLWYDIELLDTAGRKLFTGVSTFVNLLNGAVSVKRENDDDIPIEVRRLLHPGGTDANDISYAILVPMYGTISDYSGWVVSLFCATDHSGFGNQMRKYAEDAIQQYSQDISLSEIHIEMDKFRAYLKQKLKHHSEKRERSSLTPTEKEILYYTESIDVGIDLSAFVMELFVVVYFVDMGYKIKWRYRNKEILGRSEIDVLAYDESTVQIIECSRHLPMNEKGRKRILRELMKKKESIEKSEISRKEIILKYITVKDITREPFRSTARKFRQEGIEVEDISSLLEKSQHHKEPLIQLLQQIDHLRDTSGMSFSAHKKKP